MIPARQHVPLFRRLFSHPFRCFLHATLIVAYLPSLRTWLVAYGEAEPSSSYGNNTIPKALHLTERTRPRPGGRISRSVNKDLPKTQNLLPIFPHALCRPRTIHLRNRSLRNPSQRQVRPRRGRNGHQRCVHRSRRVVRESLRHETPAGRKGPCSANDYFDFGSAREDHERLRHEFSSGDFETVREVGIGGTRQAGREGATAESGRWYSGDCGRDNGCEGRADREMGRELG